MNYCNTINNYSHNNKLIDWINPFHHLESRVKDIGTKSILTSHDKSDLRRTFELANGWVWPASRMKKLIDALPIQHIKQLVSEAIQEGDDKAVAKQLDKYLNVLSKAALLDLSDMKTSAVAAIKFHSNGLIKNTVLANRLTKEGRALFKEFLYEVKYFGFHILDILVTVTGINEIGQTKHSPYSDDRMQSYEADRKIELYLKLISYPAIVFGLIFTYVQFTALAVALTTVSILAILTGLIAYQKYFRPCPKDHAGLKNLTLDALSSRQYIYPRQDILKEIEQAFKEKKGVLLVGNPGSGKSFIPKSIVEQIDSNKMFSFIKDAQVFACGGSAFKSYSHKSPTIGGISDRFKNNRDQVIFFFDEFHTLFKKEGMEGSNAGEEIKMFCEDFKYVIGATTTEEFESLVKNQTAIVDRRFKVIHVGIMEDEKIKTALSLHLQNIYPKIELGSKVIEYIVEKAQAFNPKTSKIDAAQSLLNRAVREMTNTEFKDLESKITSRDEEKKLLEQELLHSEVEDRDEICKKLEAKIAELNSIKEELKLKTNKLERFQKIESYYLKLKEQSYLMADSKTNLKAGSSKERNWIILNAKINLVKELIAKSRKELEMTSCLDKALIDKILSERVKTAI